MSNRALPTVVYTAQDEMPVTVGPFLGVTGQPLTFAGERVEVVIRDSPTGIVFSTHSALSPNDTAQDGITSDGRGNITYTIFGIDLPAFEARTRLSVQLRRTLSPDTASARGVTLGHGEVIVRPTLFTRRPA